MVPFASSNVKCADELYGSCVNNLLLVSLNLSLLGNDQTRARSPSMVQFQLLNAFLRCLWH